MKKFFTLLAVSLGFLSATAQDVVTFEGDYFSSKIDDPQYMGPQLYGDGTYNWTDEKTTLSSELTDLYMDGCYWGGGVAISNYIEPDINKGSYNTQLAVPVSNGSENFAVVYGDYTYVYFNDGEARTIKSMDVCPTTYLLNSEMLGDGFAGTLAGDPNGWFKVTVVADDDDDNFVEFYLCKDGVVQQGWETVDLSSLGEVSMLTFYFSGSDMGSWGLNTPAYFAFDNMKIGDAATADVTIGKGGYSTFVSESNMAVPAGVTAYYATAANDDAVALEEITDGVIPAGAGVVLKGEEGKTYTFAETDAAASELAGNLMVGVADASTFTNNGHVYVISTVDGVTAFYQYTGTTFPEGKAYLNMPGAKVAMVKIAGNVTGIKGMQNAECRMQNYYNLNGARVNENFKGIVIKNGKKVLVK